MNSVLSRMWSCWWPPVQSGRCATDTSVTTWNVNEFWNSSVVSWSHLELFRATHSEENVLVQLLKYSWVV